MHTLFKAALFQVKTYMNEKEKLYFFFIQSLMVHFTNIYEEMASNNNLNMTLK